MANTKTSALPTISTMAGTDVFYVLSSMSTTPVDNILTLTTLISLIPTNSSTALTATYPIGITTASTQNITLSSGGTGTFLAMSGSSMTWLPTSSASGITVTGSTGQVMTYSSSTTILGVASNTVGGMTLFATASPTTASSVTISGLSPGRYLLILNIKQNTSGGNERITFNADTGNNYAYNVWLATSSSAMRPYFETSQANFGLQNNTNTVGGYTNLYLYFNTAEDTGHTTLFQGFEVYDDSSLGYTQSVGSGIYTGSANLSSITYTISAGSITGTATVYQMN